MKKRFFFLMAACLMGITSWAQDVVSISTAEELAAFAEKVNSGENAINAQLTADVDFTAYPAVEIGTADIAYEGTFDGQGHTITVGIVRDAVAYASLFRKVGESGVIKNLTTDGTITTNNKRATGIAGQLYGQIQNCASFVEIISSCTGDNSHSGIVAQVYAGSSVKFCLSAVKITGEEVVCCAGIVGWASEAATVSNCLSIAEMTISPIEDPGYPSDYICRNNSNLTERSQNNYYVDTSDLLDIPHASATEVTYDQLASGEVCFLLNGDQSDVHWYQTIGEDAIPVLDNTHKQVYATGNLNCLGKSVDGSEVVYSNDGKEFVPIHSYVNDICTVCNKVNPDALQIEDGYYQIGTAEELVAFARRVNNGENTINAQLTDDVDFTAYPAVEIGTADIAYGGTFDGQGHTITVAFVRDGVAYASLFRKVGESGVIKNLITDGTITTNNKRATGIAGQLYGQIRNCASFVEIISSCTGDNSHSGIVAQVYAGSSVESCLSAVKITGDDIIFCAGIVGWASEAATVSNCLSIAEMTISPTEDPGYASDYICRNSSNLTELSQNNYYVDTSALTDTPHASATEVTYDQLESGEVCYMLNGDQSNIQWYQNIGVDAYPMPFADRRVVYKINKTCGNVIDAASFAAFRTEVLNNEQEYCDNVAAQQTLVEAYRANIPILGTCNDLESLINTFNEKVKEFCDAVINSEKAYTEYQNKVYNTLTYLETNPDFTNAQVDELISYLTEAEEPSDLFPNGTAPYILEEGLLNEEEIAAETAKIDEMLLEATLRSPDPGANITILLANPDFADGFNGWEGKLGTSIGKSPNNTMHAAECLNATMDMYQTLTDLKNGIYELKVNGAFRPYPSDNRYSTNYAAMLYANDMNNFFQANIEDMIYAEDAVDDINCHLSGTNPDLVVSDIDGNIIGYTMNGVIGCCNAFSAGRYPNSILVNVTDGSLTVGIKQPGTGNSNDWFGFGNIQLIYHGTIEEATKGLDNTLACMMARANTLVNVYEPSFGEDYQSYPNFPQMLKDQLKETMKAAAAATDNAEKYKLIETFSSLFQQVYEGKMAYINLMKQTMALAEWAVELAPSLGDEEKSEMNTLIERLSAAYVDGSATPNDIEKDHITSLSFVPKEVDGVYQLSSTRDIVMFALFVNKGLWNSSNAALVADIDLTAYPSLEIGTADIAYGGTFDGQGHTITVAFVRDGVAYASLFRKVGESGVIKNLITNGTITTNNKRATGIAGQLYGQIRNCASFVEIISSCTGDNSHSGIVSQVYAGSSVESCLSAVKITGEDIIFCAGIVGWASEAATVSNCLSIAEMTISPTEDPGYASDYICRNSSNLTELSQNNYYVDTSALVDTPHASATEVTYDQLESGEVCYMLNGDQSDIQWYQNIGEDAYPMPFAKQGGKVGKDENGSFINTGIQQIAANKPKGESIYNILGQKLLKTAKGVNIVDGKKVLVK